jgi:hypothetical protein
MTTRPLPFCGLLLVVALLLGLGTSPGARPSAAPAPVPRFQTSDRCVGCHNGLLTPSGADVSIGFDWRASMMANSSRDPYWQASVRRESADHPESQPAIEDECATCHMPIVRYDAKVRGQHGQVFAHLPFAADEQDGRAAADGVSCSVCHQISNERLGTPESFNGGFVVRVPANPNDRPEYGPYAVDAGHRRIMLSSSEGYIPTQADHIRQSELCATCHTLITTALGPGGKPIGRLPEQMPYQEWLHSDYKNTQSCQSCHMPVVREPVPITRVFGIPREGVARHTFIAANFFMQRMLNRYRDALDVAALPHELTAAADETVRYLGSQSARIRIEDVQVEAGRLRADVIVENLGGHKLPTAYPSRRTWLHVIVRDGSGRPVFESGRLNVNGSVQGNDNDVNPTTFEPHYTEVRSSDEVQVYETIIGDANGQVTTGLLAGVGYLKDNRVLPRGFDKRTAPPEIAVLGDAQQDPDFVGASDRTRYSVPVPDVQGRFVVEAELLYQPIGFRWAHNLGAYSKHQEPRRFVEYYDEMASGSATTLARATRQAGAGAR